MKPLSISVAALLLSPALPAVAEQLNTINVTATRTAQTAEKSLTAVTVITREDIQRQQARNVQQALRGTPGITISNNGGSGKLTTLFLRGAESDHVLVLIDGIKVGSASAGLTAFEHLPIEQVERIEVVRGPRSSLYGSEAIGGVIQIFTRKGSRKTQPFFSIGAGSDNSYKASAGISAGNEQGWFSISASGSDTEGFNSCTGDPVTFSGCGTIEPDDDGYQNLSAQLRAGYRFSNGLEIEGSALQTEGDSEFDGGFQNHSDTVQQVLGGSLRYSPTEMWQLTLSGGRSLDESENFKDGNFASRFDTERYTASLQNDLYIGDRHILTLGLDYQDDRLDSSTAFIVSSRDNWGTYVQYQGNFSGHDLQLALRQDDNEQFGNHETGSIAWGYSLSKALRLTASYGTAYKAPSFNELYFPGFGNPDLDPEESRSIELGLEGRTDWGHWAVNAYQTQIDELIGFDSMFVPANVAKARIRGLETALQTQLNHWDINGSLTLLDPENRSSDANKGNRLARRAEQSLRIDADRSFGKYRLGASLHAQGRRYDDLANRRRLSGYATVDLRADYAFEKDWLLQAKVENLLDKNYETASFYNQPGRSLFLTIRYQPQ